MIFNFVYPQYDIPRGQSLVVEAETFITAFRPFVKEGDVCLDIGGNLGTSSVVLSKLVGETGKIITFEPNTDFVRYINENLKLNNVHNIEIYNVGLSDKNEQKIFAYARANGGIMEGFVLGNERDPHSTMHSFRCVDSAEFIFNLNLQKIDFIKIDVEGWESVILNNLKPVVDKYKPTIFTEWWTHKNKNNALFDAIEYLNYKAFNPDSMEQILREHFETNKIQDLILKPQT